MCLHLSAVQPVGSDSGHFSSKCWKPFNCGPNPVHFRPHTHTPPYCFGSARADYNNPIFLETLILTNFLDVNRVELSRILMKIVTIRFPNNWCFNDFDINGVWITVSYVTIGFSLNQSSLPTSSQVSIVQLPNFPIENVPRISWLIIAEKYYNEQPYLRFMAFP